MDEITKRNLIKFYEENQDILNIEVQFDEWDNQTDSTVLISTNKSIKGLFVFKKNTHQLMKMGHKLLPFKSKVSEGSRKYNEDPVQMLVGEFSFPVGKNGKSFMIKVRELISNIKSDINKQNEIIKEQERLQEQERIVHLNTSQNNILKELDKDGNGEVDVVEGNDFSLLLKKHQKSIIEIDRTYVQQFVKVSSYLKTKKNNVQLIFNSIKDTSNEEELNEYVGILKNEIQSYSLILFQFIKYDCVIG